MGSNACRRKFKDWRSSGTSAQATEGRSREPTRGKTTSKPKDIDEDEGEPVTKKARGRTKSSVGTSAKRK